MDKHLVDITWHPVAGRLYQTIDQSIACPFPQVPDSVRYAPDRSGRNPFAKAIANKSFFIPPETVFLFLGKRERIPGHWTFFQILASSERVCWLAYSEYVWVHNYARTYPKQI